MMARCRWVLLVRRPYRSWRWYLQIIDYVFYTTRGAAGVDDSMFLMSVLHGAGERDNAVANRDGNLARRSNASTAQNLFDLGL